VQNSQNSTQRRSCAALAHLIRSRLQSVHFIKRDFYRPRFIAEKTRAARALEKSAMQTKVMKGVRCSYPQKLVTRKEEKRVRCSLAEREGSLFL